MRSRRVKGVRLVYDGRMVNFALLGAGRIGAMHAANLAARSDARLVCVYDPVVMFSPAARAARMASEPEWK